MFGKLKGLKNLLICGREGGNEKWVRGKFGFATDPAIPMRTLLTNDVCSLSSKSHSPPVRRLAKLHIAPPSRGSAHAHMVLQKRIMSFLPLVAGMNDSTAAAGVDSVDGGSGDPLR